MKENAKSEKALAMVPAKTPARSGLMTALPDLPEDGEGGGLSSRDYVSSLARGLEVLRAFNRTRRRMTLTEVAAQTGNTRAGARRILLTLVHEGYAVSDGKLFDLTPQVLELGYSVLSAKGAWDIARPFINHLAEELRETCSAAVLDKFDVVYVATAQYHRVITVGSAVGARQPAHATATGRVLLAAQPADLLPGILQNIPLTPITSHTITDRQKFRAVLDDVREQGWALVDQELEIGLTSLAVPLRNAAGELIGSINVGVPSTRMSPQEMTEFVLPRLLETAATISTALKA